MVLVVRLTHGMVNVGRIGARLLTSESHCAATSPMVRHTVDGALIPSKVNVEFALVWIRHTHITNCAMHIDVCSTIARC